MSESSSLIVIFKRKDHLVAFVTGAVTEVTGRYTAYHLSAMGALIRICARFIP